MYFWGDKAMAQKKKKSQTQSERSGPSRAAMQWILFAFVIGLVLGAVIGYNVGRGASAEDRGVGQIGTDGALDTRITRTIIPDLAPLISVASLWERYYACLNPGLRSALARPQTAMLLLKSEGELLELGAPFFHLSDQPKGLTPATRPSL